MVAAWHERRSNLCRIACFARVRPRCLSRPDERTPGVRPRTVMFLAVVSDVNASACHNSIFLPINRWHAVCIQVHATHFATEIRHENRANPDERPVRTVHHPGLRHRAGPADHADRPGGSGPLHHADPAAGRILGRLNRTFPRLKTEHRHEYPHRKHPAEHRLRAVRHPRHGHGDCAADVSRDHLAGLTWAAGIGCGSMWPIPARHGMDDNGRMLHVILHHPEIPPNTGNVIRLCANTGASLHLIRPLGFELDDKRLRRAGLDYHEYASVKAHDDLDACLAMLDHPRVFAFTKFATRRYTDVRYADGDALLFGDERQGQGEEQMENSA